MEYRGLVVSQWDTAGNPADDQLLLHAMIPVVFSPTRLRR